MSKQVLIYVVSGVIVLIVLAVAMYFGFVSKSEEEGIELKKVTIELHDYSKENDLVKRVTITDKNDLKKLNSYYKNIAKPSEPLSVAILNEGILTFEDGTKIYVAFDMPEYCYVAEFNGSDEHFAGNAPEGFISFIQELLK